MKTLVAVLVCLASVAGAQARPDFSGTWVRVVDTATARPSVATAGDAGFRVGDMGSGWGSPLTITQRSDSLIIQYPFFGTYDLQPPVRFAYSMDGSESRNRITLSHAETQTREVLGWFPHGLVIRTRYPVPPGVPRDSIGVARTIALLPGDTLQIVTMFPSSKETRAIYTKR